MNPTHRQEGNAAWTPGNPATQPSDPSPEELQRVSDLISARLRSRGVIVHDNDSADELATLLEAVEQFENRVEARGGDLMVDEAPTGKSAEPDNPAFVLPVRADDESAVVYSARILRASGSLG